MEMSKLGFVAQATGLGLFLRVKLDEEIIYDSQLGTELTEISYNFDDSVEKSRTLSIEISGKDPQHTTLNDQGEIVYDLVANIQGFKLDDIELGHMFFEKCKYHHDFNGTGDSIVDTFWGTMGCNGRVEFQFSSPVYLWLLESM
jgi:hypothetical protein